MLHVGLDLGRKRVDVCLISGEGELVARFPAPADRDGLCGLTRRVAVYRVGRMGAVRAASGALSLCASCASRRGIEGTVGTASSQ